MGHGNGRVRTLVLRAEDGLLPEHAAKALKLDERTSGHILERLRYVDDEIVLFSTNFTPPEVSPVVASADGVLDGSSSLTQALAAGGYVEAGARRVIHALAAPPDIAGHLQVAEGAPLLRVRSTTWAKDLAPFDYYETWLRSDRIPLELNTSIQAGP
jgi:GntR family transcriptional regulator